MSVSQQLTKLQRRRGVVCSSVTRLEKRISELEDISDQPTTPDHAQKISIKLQSLCDDFQAYHMELIDLIDDDVLSEDGEILDREQETIDEHDDLVSHMRIRLNRLCHRDHISSAADETLKIAKRKLRRLDGIIGELGDALSAIEAMSDEEIDTSLLKQYASQVSNHKAELSEILHLLLSLEETTEDEEALTQQSKIERNLFKCSHLASRMLKSVKHNDGASTATVENTAVGSGVRLPKLAVPTFDGNLLHWRNFWEQFCVSIHNRPSLSNAEKLAYLQCALKNGSAKSIIEGLFQSGDQYDEAITCLTSRFDKPRQIHQTHVKMIMESPQIRDGSGRELRRLHDTIQQHTRALKSLGKEPSPEFITSIVELKLDPSTMFEWQHHSQADSDVPHYKNILEFLDTRTQASEVSMSSKRPSKPDSVISKKPWSQAKFVNSFATNSEPSNNACILCKPDKHPLYSCPKFRAMTPDKRISTLKSNGNCMNCLGKGHFASKCNSLHRCKRCSRPHHTLIHLDNGGNQMDPPRYEVSANTATPTNSFKHLQLLMTCQLTIVAPNGSSLKARALLDGGSSASFVSERVAQTLRLPRTQQNVSVSVIGGAGINKVQVKSSTQFKVCPSGDDETSVNVNALIVPRVVRDLPTTWVFPVTKWNHLRGLRLADSTFNIPSRVDLLLGVDVVMEVLRNGRRHTDDPNAPVAVETIFGWVLYGGINSQQASSLCTLAVTCHTFVETGDDLLRKFWEFEEPPTNTGAHLS